MTHTPLLTVLGGRSTIPILYRILLRGWEDKRGYRTQVLGYVVADGLMSLPLQASFIAGVTRLTVIPLREQKWDF